MSQANQTGLKIKVGALILASLGLLVGFVFLLGDVSLAEQRTLYIEFSDSGSMLKGAPIKIAGVRAGRVIEVEFLVGRDARKSALASASADEAPINVRVTIRIDEQMAAAVRKDSGFFITTQGVLGEKYLEIVPGTAQETWPAGSYIRGEDPPRLDLLMARADNILAKVEQALGGDEQLDIGGLVRSTTRLATNLDTLIETNKERIDGVFEHVDETARDARALVGYLKEGVGSSAPVEAIVKDARTVARVLARDTGPTLKAARGTLKVADGALRSAQDLIESSRPKIEDTLNRLPGVASRADATLRDAQYIVSSIKAGNGTVGQLIVDQEIYDDLKEMLRDLKRHPWKMLWRE